MVRRHLIPEANAGLFWFLREENRGAPDGNSLWRVLPASIAIHLCIGSVNAWPVFHPAPARGVVVSSGSDWSLPAVVRSFSLAIVCVDLTAAIGGKWLEKGGSRYVGMVAAKTVMIARLMEIAPTSTVDPTATL